MSLKKNTAGEPISIGSYKIHALANLFPMTGEEEQVALQLDIQDNGQRENIILYRGHVIDGRCRTLACERLGIQVKSISLPHKTPLEEVRAIVLSTGVRRNLTTAQKAIIAGKALIANPALLGKDVAIKYAITPNELSAANYILKNYPRIAGDMFEGMAISTGTNKAGKPTTSTSVQGVAAFLRGNPYSFKGHTAGHNEFEERNQICSKCQHIEPYNPAN